MKAPRVEGTLKALELYMGLSLVCFAAGTIVSWAIMSRLVDRPELLPEGAAGMCYLSLLHDAGYIVCAPAFAFIASRLVVGNRLLPALVLVPANYLIEEMIVFIWGGERVYWELPWGAAGRVAAIVLALAAALVVTRRNNRGQEQG